MGRISQLLRSRGLWRTEAKVNRSQKRYQTRENKRLKNDRDHYKNRALTAEAELRRIQQTKNTSSIQSKVDLIHVALRLFLEARISFRAVSRVLEVLSIELGLEKAPCTQTIINWVMRLSIARVQDFNARAPTGDTDPFSNGFIWLVDISIGLGSGKIFALLALDARHHQNKQRAPSLQDVHCVAVCVEETWNGQSEADLLQRVIEVTGRPVALLKDGGKDLEKARNELAGKGIDVPAIDDVSHVVANLLKHEYGEHPSLAPFLTACGKASKKLKQTVLACLAPPKISMKARFMNLHRLVNWSQQALKHSPQGRALKGSMLAKLRSAINGLPEHKLFINNFARDSRPLLDCQTLLKKNGLSHVTWGQCMNLIDTIPPTSPVRNGFIDWGEKQMIVAEKLGLSNIGLPVSSDSIESLFGTGKQHGTGEVKDANRIAARLPAKCGTLTKADAQRVIDITVRDQQSLVFEMPSLTRERRAILPNPGTLPQLELDRKRNLEMIPRAKNRSKSSNIIDISGRYEISHGPNGPPNILPQITLEPENAAAVQAS